MTKGDNDKVETLAVTYIHIAIEDVILFKSAIYFYIAHFLINFHPTHNQLYNNLVTSCVIINVNNLVVNTRITKNITCLVYENYLNTQD